MTKESSQNTVLKFLFPILKPYKWHYLMMFQIPMVAVAFHVLNGYALKLIVDTSTNGQAVVTKWDIIYPIVIFIGGFLTFTFLVHLKQLVKIFLVLR